MRNLKTSSSLVYWEKHLVFVLAQFVLFIWILAVMPELLSFFCFFHLTDRVRKSHCAEGLFIFSASPAWPDHRKEGAGCSRTAGLNTLQSRVPGGSALGRRWKWLRSLSRHNCESQPDAILPTHTQQMRPRELCMYSRRRHRARLPGDMMGCLVKATLKSGPSGGG